MTDQSALGVVVAYTEAWAGKDLETAAGYLAADVVFDGAGGRHESAEPLLRGLAGFVSQIAPGWRQLAAVAQGDQVMLMYEVSMASGRPVRLAEHFTVRDGKIRSETLVYDTAAVQAAQAVKV
jgi:ketosteroid isomerase-like protein